MVKIKRIIEEEHIPLYFNSELIGYLENTQEFYQARVNIRNEGIEGYYIVFNGEDLIIDKDGRLPVYPSNLFSKNDDLLKELLGW